MQTLFVDDHEVSRDIQPFATIDRVGNHVQRYAVFSPDGTKFAYAKRVPGGVAAVIDGKVGRPYDGIGLTEFSQDSKHAFSVGIRGQSFVAIDGKEMPGINRLDNFIFSNDGMHFAYQAYSQDGNHVVVDGKESPRYYSIFAHSLAFSPDSKHYIYGACTNIMRVAKLAVDTASGPAQSSRSLDRLGFFEYTAGNLKDAELHLRQAFDLRKNRFGDRSPEYAESANDLALFCRDSGKLPEARTLAEQAVDIRTSLLGSSNLKVAESLNTLASTYGLLGEYDLGIARFEQARSIHGLARYSNRRQIRIEWTVG